MGGLAATVDEAAFREYFEEFGGVEDAVVMYDHENKRPRGFGFITFAEEESVDKVFAKGTIQTIHEKQIEVKRAVPRDAMPPSPRTLFRPPPHGSPYNERSPYRHGPPGYPYRGRNDGYSPQPDYAGRPVDGGRGDLDPRPLYTPPAVVTGIPASIAAAPAVPAGDPSAPPTGGVMPAMPAMSGGGMVGMAPPIAMSPVGLQSPPQHLVTGGFALQNGMQGGGGAQLGAVVGSPPFGIEPQQPPAPANLADVQQQLSLTTVSDALEQLQQQQQQQQQQTQAAQQQQAAQTTIWS